MRWRVWLWLFWLCCAGACTGTMRAGGGPALASSGQLGAEAFGSVGLGRRFGPTRALMFPLQAGLGVAADHHQSEFVDTLGGEYLMVPDPVHADTRGSVIRVGSRLGFRARRLLASPRSWCFDCGLDLAWLPAATIELPSRHAFEDLWATTSYTGRGVELGIDLLVPIPPETRPIGPTPSSGVLITLAYIFEQDTIRAYENE